MALACIGGVARTVHVGYRCIGLLPVRLVQHTFHTFGQSKLNPAEHGGFFGLFVVDMCRSLDVIGEYDAQTASRLADWIAPSRQKKHL